jgi:radical SAM protein (TIGR01212 family)
MWGDKRFNSLSYQLKNIFGEKIMKVSLDAGFTCPNRDGTLSNSGCIFCNETGSGDFAGTRGKDINQQIEEQIDLLKNKFPDGKYIAYFQNFTNTYGEVDYLRKIFTEALAHPKIIGLAIATRPDCLGNDVLELLEELNKRTFLWLELGLQTTNDETAAFINRGYPLKTFDESVKNLNSLGIKTVAHLIVGLPGESIDDMLESVKHISDIGVWGVKFHLLHIIKDTSLYEYYQNSPFKLPEMDEYVDIVVNLISYLNPEVVIHRLTGDGNRSTLFAPLWSLNKKTVLNKINRELKLRDIVQGKNYLLQNKIKKC